MNTVKLEEIGRVHSVEILVSLKACIFNSRDVEDRLEELGFMGPLTASIMYRGLSIERLEPLT